MAEIYDAITGSAITVGLQGCDVCDEAIQAAQRLADERGRDVLLVDDDGEWYVHPMIGGRREAADPAEDNDDVRESRKLNAMGYRAWRAAQ